MRADNLKKQAHLLTPRELRRRGITRYDAEMILSQGINLPSPRAVATVPNGQTLLKAKCENGAKSPKLSLAASKPVLSPKNVNRNMSKMWRRRRARRRLSAQQVVTPDEGSNGEEGGNHLECSQPGHCYSGSEDLDTEPCQNHMESPGHVEEGRGCATYLRSSEGRQRTTERNVWDDLCPKLTAEGPKSKSSVLCPKIFNDTNSGSLFNSGNNYVGNWSPRRSSPRRISPRRLGPDALSSADGAQHSKDSNKCESSTPRPNRGDLLTASDLSLTSVAIKQEKPLLLTAELLLRHPATAEGFLDLDKSASSDSMPHLRPQLAGSFGRSESCKIEKKVAEPTRLRSSSTSLITDMPILTKEQSEDTEEEDIPLARLVSTKAAPLDDKPVRVTRRRSSNSLSQANDHPDTKLNIITNKGSRKSNLKPGLILDINAAAQTVDISTTTTTELVSASPRYSPALEKLLTNGFDVNHNSPVKSQLKYQRFDLSPRTKRMNSPFSLTPDSSSNQSSDLFLPKTRKSKKSVRKSGRGHLLRARSCQNSVFDSDDGERELRVPKMTIRLRHVRDDSEGSDSSGDKSSSPIKANSIIYEIMPSPETTPKKFKRKRNSSLSVKNSPDTTRPSPKRSRVDSSGLAENQSSPSPRKLTRVKLKIGGIELANREIPPMELPL